MPVALLALALPASAPAATPGTPDGLALVTTRTEPPCVPPPGFVCPAVEPRVQSLFVRLGLDGSRLRTSVMRRPARRVAVSPDGRRLAWEVDGGGIQISTRGRRRWRTVTRSGHHATWSTNGRRLAFVRRGRLWTIGAGGRRAVRLTRGHADGAPAWGPDGETIAFVRMVASPRCRIAAAVLLIDARGGRARRVYRPSGRCRTVARIDWSPDGRRLVAGIEDASMDAVTRVDGEAIVVIHPRRRTARTILAGGAAPAWSPDGRRIAYRGSRCSRRQGDADVDADVDGGTTEAPPVDEDPPRLCTMRPDGRAHDDLGLIPGDPLAQSWPVWLVRRP